MSTMEYSPISTGKAFVHHASFAVEGRGKEDQPPFKRAVCRATRSQSRIPIFKANPRVSRGSACHMVCKSNILNGACLTPAHQPLQVATMMLQLSPPKNRCQHNAGGRTQMISTWTGLRTAIQLVLLQFHSRCVVRRKAPCLNTCTSRCCLRLFMMKHG